MTLAGAMRGGPGAAHAEVMSAAPHATSRPVTSSVTPPGLAPADDLAGTSAWAPDEPARPGRAAGVALGALGMLLGVLVGLAALAATAVDLAVWALKSS